MTRDRTPAAAFRSGVLYHLPRLAIALVAVLPLIFVVSASLRATGLPPPRGFELLPWPLAPENYSAIFDLVPMGRFLFNSLVLVALAIPVTLVTASFAGFGMALLPPGPRRSLVIGAVLLMLVPATALWLTRFVLFRHLGLIDTVWALAAPAIMGTSPLFVLLYFWTFRRVPREYFEAARLDGAGVLRQWWHIAIPLAHPTTVAVSVLAFIFYWSDFFGPLLYLKSESRYTLPVGLQILQQMDKTNWPLLMAATVVMTAPIILMFLAVQRYFWPENHRI